jgi:hypothetical protein
MFMPVAAAFVVLAAPVVGPLPLVTAVERIGGFEALGAGVRLCRPGLWRRWTTLAAAQALSFVPWLGLDLLHVPARFQGLSQTVALVLVNPLVVLVSLSVYEAARDAHGAGAAQLRADLDAR